MFNLRVILNRAPTALESLLLTRAESVTELTEGGFTLVVLPDVDLEAVAESVTTLSNRAHKEEGRAAWDESEMLDRIKLLNEKLRDERRENTSGHS